MKIVELCLHRDVLYPGEPPTESYLSVIKPFIPNLVETMDEEFKEQLRQLGY
jgi:hypothetical protein